MLRWIVNLALILTSLFVVSFHPSMIEATENPIVVSSGQWYGVASWYGGGEPLNEHVTMGHRFDPEALEAAMGDLPFGSSVRVTNLQNGNSIIVRVTDRGPSRRFSNRIVDLTRGSFAKIAPLQQGLIPVLVEQIS